VQEKTTSTPEVVPIAPPVRAVLLKNEQLLTETMLPAADRAPPIPLDTSTLAQLRNVMPEIEIDVFAILIAGPEDATRLQSNTEPLIEPYKFRKGTLSLTKMRSPNVAAERNTVAARRK
jgi:hypothetical protein